MNLIISMFDSEKCHALRKKLTVKFLLHISMDSQDIEIILLCNNIQFREF